MVGKGHTKGKEGKKAGAKSRYKFKLIVISRWEQICVLRMFLYNTLHEQ